MPYNKDKQQAFQAAQQGFDEAQGLYTDIIRDSASYGHQLKHLKNEVNEAFQQIENALENASEHQREQLKRYKRDLKKMVDEVNMH